MGHIKLIRFAELETFENVLQFPKNIKGKWNEFFKNEGPIILELACGKGEYAVGLGMLYPQKNFIGVDLKGNRIWVGAMKALENNSGILPLERHEQALPDAEQDRQITAILDQLGPPAFFACQFA